MPSTQTDRLFGVNSSVAVKAPVRTVTTGANVELTGLQTIGGVTLNEGDRVLVKDQADPTQNGIYNASQSAWQRPGDFDGAYDVVQGTLVLTLLNGGTGPVYQLTTEDPQIGTSALTFVPFWNAAAFDSAGNVLRYGADPTGATDSTTAIQNAINQNGRVYLPQGTYLVGTLFYPNQIGFTFVGDGPNVTILQAKNPNAPVLQKVQTAGVLNEGYFGFFSVKGSATAVATSTTTAFDCSGMRTCTVEKVFGLSTGGFGFASLFSLSAYPYLCYGNRFPDCGVEQQTGWTKVWDFNNGGTANAANNSNVTTIINPWVYSNTGLSIGIDAQRSAQTQIIGGDFEANPGATAVNSGNITSIRGTWFEGNAHNITYKSAGDGVANQGLVAGCYLSTADVVDFTGCQGNVWIGNVEAGDQTWTNNNGTNVRLKGSTDAQVFPTIAVSAGQAGTLTFNSATLLTQPQLTNELVYELVYVWAAGASGGYTQFTVSSTNNWTVQGMDVGCILASNGVPTAVGIGGSNTFNVSNGATTNYTITVLVRVKHTDP